LVFAEVALAVVLLVSAGLIVRTFEKLAATDPGFDPNNLVTATASLQDAKYATATAGAHLFKESLERIRQIPGVESAAVTLTPPYARALNNGMRVAGTTREGITNCTYVTPGLVETLGMRVLRGRHFTNSDNAENEPVVIVNEAFVKRYLTGIPGPIGVYLNMGDRRWRIIGVVNDVEVKMGWGGLGPLDRFAGIYVPASQFPDKGFALVNVWFSPTWIVRTRGNVPGLRKAMSDALTSVDPLLPFSEFKTPLDVRGATLQPQRYRSVLFSTLAGLAVLLAALGLYGLIAESVAQRTREMGIRLALGATVAQAVRTALLPGMTLSIAGIAAGVALSLFTTRYLKSIIWGLSGTDPTTYFSVAVLLILTVAVASTIPAIRLTSLDPAQTLRDE
jgi:predicted permease